MKERTVRELSGEIWAELHMEIDSRRQRGDDLYGSLDCKAIDAAVDVITAVLARNAGKTITNDAEACPSLVRMYTDECNRRRRLSARRLGITLQ